MNKLERKYRRFAIQNLMLYVVVVTFAVYILDNFAPLLTSRLYLDMNAVMQGEIWRLFTFIFIPPDSSMIFIAFVLYFYYIIGIHLEAEWGVFRFNLYYLMGMLATILSAVIGWAIFDWGFATAAYLNLTLFLAYARLNPDQRVLIFFIIPVRIKYLAWFYWVIIGYTVLFGSIPDKITVVLSLVNYYVFFGRDMIEQNKLNRQVAANRKRFKANLPKAHETMHRCSVCGLTEEDDPELEFRYCSKCEGELEYCMNHLHDHEHKTVAEKSIEDKSEGNGR